MILVTGASGQLGRSTMAHLKGSGVKVIGGTREPGEATDLQFIDFDAPESLQFTGVDTLLFISAGTAEDDVVINRHRRVIEAAERDGVQHIVYTSLATEGDHLSFALAHRWTERRLKAGTTPWTVLRNGLYAELVGQLLKPQNGIIAAAFGDGAIAAVARQDLAEAASLVAQHPSQHTGRTYNLVGHQPITAQKIADALGAAYQPKDLEDLRKRLNAGNLLPFQPAMLHSIHSAATHGFLATTGTELESLLKRPPSDPLLAATATATATS